MHGLLPPPPKKRLLWRVDRKWRFDCIYFFHFIFIIKIFISEVCPQRNKAHYLWPPLSSLRLSFHTLPKATFTSRPSSSVCPSGGASLAVVPGKRVENIEPKSYRYKENKDRLCRNCWGCVHNCRRVENIEPKSYRYNENTVKLYHKCWGYVHTKCTRANARER